MENVTPTQIILAVLTSANVFALTRAAIAFGVLKQKVTGNGARINRLEKKVFPVNN